FVERTADAELTRRLPSGPVVAAIVRVVAVDDNRVARTGERRQMRVQLVLAVVAAVRRVGAVLGAIELAGMNDLMAQSEVVRDLHGEASMALRIAGAVGGDGKRAITEGPGRDVGEIGAVDAAAVSDDHRTERRERVAQRALFFDRRAPH